MGLGLSRTKSDEATMDRFTGLTRKQKKTIERTWNLLAKDSEKHGIKIFIRIFRRYPHYRRYFLEAPNVKMSDLVRDPGVLRHCRIFKMTMDNFVRVACHKPHLFPETQLNQAMAHKDMSLGLKDSHRITATLIEYFKENYPVEFTKYAEDCLLQFLLLLTKEYVYRMDRLRDDDENNMTSFMIPAHASKKSMTKAEREAYWAEHRDYWHKKRSAWVGMDTKTLTIIEDEDNDDNYIHLGLEKKNNMLCGCGSSPRRNPVVKPTAEEEITRPLSTVKEEVNVKAEVPTNGAEVPTNGAEVPTNDAEVPPNDEEYLLGCVPSNEYSCVSVSVSTATLGIHGVTIGSPFNDDRSRLSSDSDSDVGIIQQTPEMTTHDRFRNPKLSSLIKKDDEKDNTRRSSDGFNRLQKEKDDAQYPKSTSVPGRNIDDLKVPLPSFFKRDERRLSKQRRASRVLFENEPRGLIGQTDVSFDSNMSTYDAGPRERRRRWNEFTCCDKYRN